MKQRSRDRHQQARSVLMEASTLHSIANFLRMEVDAFRKSSSLEIVGRACERQEPRSVAGRVRERRHSALINLVDENIMMMAHQPHQHAHIYTAS
eukprot:6180786-Pleurochrysis_carterae.AAC.1